MWNECSRHGAVFRCNVSASAPKPAVDNARPRVNERGSIVDAHDAGLRAFGGYEDVMAAYRAAVAEQYRFFSYGDAMFIEKSSV